MNLNIKSSCPSTCVWSGDIKWMEFQSPNSSLLRLGSNIQKRECMYTHSHTHTNTLKVCKSPNIQLQRSHVWNLRSSHTGRVQKPTEDVGAECPPHTHFYLSVRILTQEPFTFSRPLWVSVAICCLWNVESSALKGLLCVPHLQYDCLCLHPFAPPRFFFVFSPFFPMSRNSVIREHAQPRHLYYKGLCCIGRNLRIEHFICSFRRYHGQEGPERTGVYDYFMKCTPILS